MVVCLCRLHNYCVNERLLGKSNHAGTTGETTSDEEEEIVPESTAVDLIEIAAHGGIRVQATGGDYVPEDLMGSGHHNDDTSRAQRRLYSRSGLGVGRSETLPRDKLHRVVVSGGFHRPEPKKKEESSTSY
jgi:hypothetical protein